MIKIVSGWSHPGGSTHAFALLTNLFNDNGIDCTFYGPHQYHLTKCKAADIRNLIVSDSDIIINHFLKPLGRPICRMMVFSSHETTIFPVKDVNVLLFDKIHFVSDHQRKYHKINFRSFIIPNVLPDLVKNPKPNDKIAGIIGSIDINKQVHISIKRALEDGFNKIYIYGTINNSDYFNKEVFPLMKEHPQIEFKGYKDNKQEMYDSLTDVYQDSLSETWGYIRAECKLTGTNFHGNQSTENQIVLNNNEILELWKKELEI